MNDKNIPEDIPEVFSERRRDSAVRLSYLETVSPIIKKELDIGQKMCYITYVGSFR